MTGDDGGRFHEVARPDERTIQKVAAGEVRPPRRGRKPGAIQGEVEVTTVRRDVWAKAQELASHPSHIQIVSEEEVIVWNHPAPWPV